MLTAVSGQGLRQGLLVVCVGGGAICSSASPIGRHPSVSKPRVIPNPVFLLDLGLLFFVVALARLTFFKLTKSREIRPHDPCFYIRLQLPHLATPGGKKNRKSKPQILMIAGS